MINPISEKENDDYQKLHWLQQPASMRKVTHILCLFCVSMLCIYSYCVMNTKSKITMVEEFKVFCRLKTTKLVTVLRSFTFSETTYVIYLFPYSYNHNFKSLP